MNTWKLTAGILVCMFLAVSAGGCLPTQLRTILSRENILITTDEFEGVIFREGDWVPTVEQVRALEEELHTYLPQHRDAFDALQKPIEERLPTYKRQYWGVLENDERLIFANFFCNAFNYDWTHDRVFVLDGGDCYFQILYDIETGTFRNLLVNGSA